MDNRYLTARTLPSTAFSRSQESTVISRLRSEMRFELIYLYLIAHYFQVKSYTIDETMHREKHIVFVATYCFTAHGKKGANSSASKLIADSFEADTISIYS